MIIREMRSTEYGELENFLYEAIYGHLDDETPSLALSVMKNFRRRGIATALLKKIFVLLAEKNFKRVSLSVQKENSAAVALYRKLNFEVVEVRGEEFLMVGRLEG